LKLTFMSKNGILTIVKASYYSKTAVFQYFFKDSCCKRVSGVADSLFGLIDIIEEQFR